MSLMYVKGSDTSKAAAISIQPGKDAMKAKVFGIIKEAGAEGMTCDEVEQYLDLRHQTASARVRELSLDSQIKDTGTRRDTRSGRSARVYAVVGAEILP